MNVIVSASGGNQFPNAMVLADDGMAPQPGCPAILLSIERGSGPDVQVVRAPLSTGRGAHARASVAFDARGRMMSEPPSMEAIISGSGRGVTRLRLPFDLEHAPEVLIVFGVAYRAVLAVNGVGHYHPAPDHFVYYVKREDMGSEYRP